MWKKATFITLALLGLAALAAEMFAPRYVTSPREARERALQQDLFTMGQILDQYTLDHHKYPRSLDDLVAGGYLKQVPSDLMTGRRDTWIVEWSDDPEMPGIKGVRSASGPSK
jgi:general secretion pathway protein G